MFHKIAGLPGIHWLIRLPVTWFYLWIRLNSPSLGITLRCCLRNMTSLWQQWHS